MYSGVTYWYYEDVRRRVGLVCVITLQRVESAEPRRELPPGIRYIGVCINNWGHRPHSKGLICRRRYSDASVKRRAFQNFKAADNKIRGDEQVQSILERKETRVKRGEKRKSSKDLSTRVWQVVIFYRVESQQKEPWSGRDPTTGHMKLYEAAFP